MARALGGEYGLLDESIFKRNPHSEIICLGALDVLEQEDGIDAIDAIIMGGASPWTSVRTTETAIEIAARMCNQNWEPHVRNAETVRNWWQANRETFTPNP